MTDHSSNLGLTGSVADQHPPNQSKSPQRHVTVRHANAISLAIGSFTGAGTLWWTYLVIGHATPVAGLLDFILAAYLSRSFLTLQRRVHLGGILAAVLLGGAWLGAIARHKFLGAPAEFSDLFSLDDLFLYYGLHGAWYWQAMLLLTAGLLLATIANLRLPARSEIALLAPILVALALLGGKLYLPAVTAHIVTPAIAGHSWFPEAAWFGQWDAFLRSALRYADREVQIADLARRTKPDFGFLDLKLEAPKRRNVYFVLLESFYDPREIDGLSLNAEPMAPLFLDWRQRGSAHAVSPVFGERSPDAEFEFLCGLPATLDSGQVAYAQLTADRVDCLPRKLASLGWHTESWVPVIPSLFGSDLAYARIGLETRVFGDGMDMRDRDGEALSAQSLLQQNLARLRILIAKNKAGSGSPIFNYVFTTAGHFPFALDESKRPAEITSTPHSEMLTGFVNNIRYNSQAVDAYVRGVRDLDPNGIIIILGDHPPPLPMNAAGITYPPEVTRKYNVPLIVIDGERGALSLPAATPTYHLPFLVANLLTEGRFCREQNCPISHRLAVRPLPGGVIAYQPDGSAELCLKAQGLPCADAMQKADSFRLALYALTASGDSLAKFSVDSPQQ